MKNYLKPDQAVNLAQQGVRFVLSIETTKQKKYHCRWVTKTEDNAVRINSAYMASKTAKLLKELNATVDSIKELL